MSAPALDVISRCVPTPLSHSPTSLGVRGLGRRSLLRLSSTPAAQRRKAASPRSYHMSCQGVSRQGVSNVDGSQSVSRDRGRSPLAIHPTSEASCPRGKMQAAAAHAPMGHCSSAVLLLTGTGRPVSSRLRHSCRDIVWSRGSPSGCL
ncbi:hypothetical protein NDU88_005372 [Pleurodeles waltl]|uniref:Uncharacterized protein n=1 Tax=Pleurodeles waltl TaxID=8319 RepID=A0AAV7UI06_PLEWA|nr:hypothetical protein NDU88_005372 [Pleurodeles waltl]